MNKNDILEALLGDALYTCEFDVTAGDIPEELVGRDGRRLNGSVLSADAIRETWQKGKRKRERQTLTEERDSLTRERNDLTVELDSLTVENTELS